MAASAAVAILVHPGQREVVNSGSRSHLVVELCMQECSPVVWGGRIPYFGRLCVVGGGAVDASGLAWCVAPGSNGHHGTLTHARSIAANLFVLKFCVDCIFQFLC